MKFSRLLAALFLFMSLLLTSACSQVTGITPETAIVSRLLDTRSKVDPFSFTILQKQALKNHVLLLVRYHAKRTKGGTSLCYALYDLKRDKNNAWASMSGSVECSKDSPVNTMPEVGSWGTAKLAGNDGPYFYIYGRLTDGNTAALTVTWDDGVEQTVRLHENIYLFVREGEKQNFQLLGKDSSGKAIYDEHFSP